MFQEEEEQLRLLGLIIDNKLNYEAHTDVVCGRIVGKIKHLEKLQGMASLKTHKEVTVSLVHSTIEFCAELYLRPYRNQVRVQKKLNTTMRMLLNRDFDSPVAEMMTTLDWLNIPNMWRWCSVRTLKRIMRSPGQTPYLWSLIDMNTDPRYVTRYSALKTKWRKFTRWARESFLYTVVDTYNALGMHGRFFEDYEHMRDSVKAQLKTDYGNENIK